MTVLSTSIQEYCELGTSKANELPNRGPLQFEKSGELASSALQAYRKYGFYIFQDVINKQEIEELREAIDLALARAPVDKDSALDSMGNPAIGEEFRVPTFKYAKPLSDPFGGTDVANGRYEAKMSEPTPKNDAPKETIYFISGPCQVIDAFLRHYGNPKLLQVAASVNGPDFTPFTEGIWIKEPELGTSVAWHQDGTTLWGRGDWHEDIHGFNFMTNLYSTNSENALWVVPGSHKQGKIDIKQRVKDAGTDRLSDAVPMLCKPGDVAICNRQILHGSFANTSKHRRITLVHGFHLRSAVLGAKSSYAGRDLKYSEERVNHISRMISLAADARSQWFSGEEQYVYQPLADDLEANRFNDETRESVVKDYNLHSLVL